MHRSSKLLISLLALQLGGCASWEPSIAPVGVPDTLNPGATASLGMIVPAQGVQIYECRTSTDQPAVHAWTFVGPEADLFGTRGDKIGRHYGGPHWEALDGSKVVGTLKERVDAPKADSIPWLLLATKSVGEQGVFSKVTSIQRVNTVGGVAPRDGCTQAAAGARARVKYAADYYFFTAN